jgi:hypothetical protein
MKRLATFIGVLAVISEASLNCSAAVKDFDGGAADGGTFLAGANWNDAIGSDDNTVPGPADRALINAGFVVTYGTSAATTVGSLIVGADWPTTGDLGTPGTLNMSAGKLTVTGGGDNFQIGRACCAGDGAVNLSGTAELEIGGSDPIVGTRENGVLDVGGSATVHPTQGVENYWRLGNYGPSFDVSATAPTGLQGNGLLNVHGNGSFRAHVIFIADNDATGEVRVADNGSVILTSNLVPRPSGFQAMGSATVRMSGSGATLEAFNLESESLPGEIPTKYRFDADAGGVSEIKLTDAINITNNDLEVNLGSFVLGPLAKITLFDGDQSLAANRIFGTFASLRVNGVLNPTNYSVVYDQAVGDIQLMRIPEPSTMLSLGFGIVVAIAAKRRTPRLAKLA